MSYEPFKWKFSTWKRHSAKYDDDFEFSAIDDGENESYDGDEEQDGETHSNATRNDKPSSRNVD